MARRRSRSPPQAVRSDEGDVGAAASRPRGDQSSEAAHVALFRQRGLERVSASARLGIASTAVLGPQAIEAENPTSGTNRSRTTSTPLLMKLVAYEKCRSRMTSEDFTCGGTPHGTIRWDGRRPLPRRGRQMGDGTVRWCRTGQDKEAIRVLKRWHGGCTEPCTVKVLAIRSVGEWA